jgi:hypothetical protein
MQYAGPIQRGRESKNYSHRAPFANVVVSDIDAQNNAAGMSQMATWRPCGGIGYCGRFGKIKSEKVGTFWDILRHGVLDM